MSRAQTTALVFGTILLLAGIIGFVTVGVYWVSAGCSPSGLHGCSHPAPLSLKNSTLLIVGTVISTGVLVIGGLITFLAAYFPDPKPSIHRRIEDVRLDEAIRRDYPPPPPSPGPASVEK
ncbi:MAG: hypothetical protein ACLQC7_08435 [Thermoplasmata archaeon]